MSQPESRGLHPSSASLPGDLDLAVSLYLLQLRDLGFQESAEFSFKADLFRGLFRWFQNSSLPKRVTLLSTCLPCLVLEGSGRREMIPLVASDGVSASEHSGDALLVGPPSPFRVVG